MPASTIATDIRGAIKIALAGCTANIYDSVPEAPIVPAIVVVPDAPYMELEVLGKSTTRVKLNYTITACVAYFSNAAALKLHDGNGAVISANASALNQVPNAVASDATSLQADE